ncbi:hypothetical protein BX661DRAFT_190277 [Kickxella alabastrina]|uniref:uncharacterized protein n=1 Tax=Kickxella alabastrina TaxID=61397 RepID=UPI00221FDFC7|nr:uncharacterized protein BX661DRAFT_190277 [Kickxella alabastrina]KAI7819553.1 hypothetical protein BX661DRAFT_190277 [Kickxella alabastrina]
MKFTLLTLASVLIAATSISTTTTTAALVLPVNAPVDATIPAKKLFTRKRHEGVFGLHNYFHRHPELIPPYAPVRSDELDETE